MSVSLLEVMAAASERLAPLTAECAGYVALAAADQLCAAPRVLTVADVQVEASGAVRIVGGMAADDAACERALRALLEALMLVARSGSASVMRIGGRPMRGGVAPLIQELELALIPANRAAARRSLARLHRETSRALEAGLVVPDLASAGVSLEASEVAEANEPSDASGAGEARGARVEQAAARPASAPLELETAGEAELDVCFGAPDDTLLEHELTAEASIEIEVSPVPPGQVATPLEPFLRRRESHSMGPDIHKTPYLGTVVTSTSTASYLDSAENAPNNGSLDRSVEQDEDTTEPMPIAEEWLASDELEEVEETPAPTWRLAPPPPPAPAPAPARFTAPESNVRELIGRFTVGEAEPTAQLLSGLKRLAGITATPPPVGVAEHTGAVPAQPVAPTDEHIPMVKAAGPDAPAEATTENGTAAARIVSIAGS